MHPSVPPSSIRRPPRISLSKRRRLLPLNALKNTCRRRRIALIVADYAVPVRTHLPRPLHFNDNIPRTRGRLF